MAKQSSNSNHPHFLTNIKYLFTAALVTCLLGSCGYPVESYSNSPSIAQTAQISLGEGYGDRYFYQPRKDYPKTPSTYQLPYQEVFIPSTNNITLHGWLIPAKGGKKKSKLTVVYSHGNMGTVGYHVNRVRWMAQAGINVLLYDYRGYGKSTGQITRKGLIDDAYRAMVYAANRPDLKHTKIISYGHSLGGAKSIAALGLNPTPPRLVLAVDESSFASYKDMAEIKAGLTGRKLVSETFSPQQLISKVKVPVILIHGTNDGVTPLSQGRKLRNAAQQSSLQYYWEVKGANHYNCLTINQQKRQKRLLQIFRTL